ncbi:MAG: SRPBCC family protein [Acidothermus cellulolyticus]|nr:SRPBCC family protein [Acidothermus cellulolyticus]
MDLSHEFDVPTGIDSAWALFTDPARVASCMPGAKLDGIGDDGELTGRVKVKVGAIVTEFRGRARFVEQDAAQHRLRLVAEGTEVRGASSASAVVSVQLSAKGDDATHAAVTISLTTAGKIAQFGRNVLQDVSERLLGQFLANVERQLRSGDAAVAVGMSDTTTAGGTSKAVARESTPTARASDQLGGAPAAEAGGGEDVVDLLGLAGPAVVKRYLPAGVAALVGLLLGVLLGRARRPRTIVVELRDPSSR